ncbi:MAG: hypothetical protein KDC44_07295 [Phaeodactylibacter sp.]|nr:hypothetical protein [Phaeodactylibacter sp.]
MAVFFKHMLLLLLLPLCLPLHAQAPKKIKLPWTLHEISGLYLEDAHTFWWHNDSGGRPILYQTNQKGVLKDSIVLAQLHNKDWEDLTHDHAGTFYIGDFGNNCNCRKDLKIYLYRPADQYLDSILFDYPDQTAFPPSKAYRNFDMEGFFWHQDSLHLFSKNKLWYGNYFTKHYELPARPGTYTAELRDSLYLKNRVVTGATISEDGETVVLVSYYFKKWLGFLPTSRASIFVFRDFEDGQYLKGHKEKQVIPPFFIATQYESVDFLNKDAVYVGSEKTLFIRPRAKLIILRD